MPKVQDIFSKLNSVEYFFTLDLLAGYHHLPCNDALIPKTAFISPFRKYRYFKVTIRLQEALVYVKKLINKVLKDLLLTSAYLDDIIISSKSIEDCVDHLQQVFHKLWNATLSMKLSKYNLFAKEIQYLGHILSATEIKPLPPKSEAIKIMQPSKNAKQSISFHWPCRLLSKLHQKYCLNHKTTALTCHDVQFEWILNNQAASINLKGAFIQVPKLHYLDPLKWHIVYTDDSDNACGAQLLQEHNCAML